MIERYRRAQMAAVWGRRLERWLAVELAALEAMAESGLVPRQAPAAVRERARLDPARIAALEARTGHDVIAFLSALEETVGPEGRWLHFGLTSSDVVDTAFAMELVEAADVLLGGFDRLLAVLEALARAHRRTPMIGRTHGVHAEPTTFGLVVLGWHAEVRRARARLAAARETVRRGKLSGAVGTLSHVPPEVEAAALARLGLEPEPVATQVVPRDRHAEYLAAVALGGAAVERIALGIRLHAQTEIGELLEPFGEEQRGSSAMPHKRNPVLCENLCGLARLLRGYLLAELESAALWYERDISHSSVERVAAPDATILLDFMIHRLAEILEGLEVRADRMRANLERHDGLVYSGAVLLALVRAGLARREAYGIVQRAALAGEGSFRERIAAAPEVRAVLRADEIAACFDLDHHLRHVDRVFERALEGA